MKKRCCVCQEALDVSKSYAGYVDRESKQIFNRHDECLQTQKREIRMRDVLFKRNAKVLSEREKLPKN